jgi:hypothetical protein
VLASFDEFVLRGVDKKSQYHIREAIRCYEAGAYRSSIVATYVALCFDLIEKLKILAQLGDAEAKIHVVNLENLQKNHLAGDQGAIKGLLNFERSLPELFFTKFEFFGRIEYEEIQRLVSDRNKCAHPTFMHSEEPYQPSAEVARLHLRNVLVLVLTHEPRQGRAALTSICSLIQSEYFPKEVDDIRVRLQSSPLRNAREGLVRAFIDDVMFGVINKDSPYYLSTPAIKSLEVIADFHPNIAIPRMVNNANKLIQSHDKTSIQYGGIISLRSPNVANLLDESSKPTLRAFVSNPSVTSKAVTLNRALKVDWMRQYAIEQIKQLTSADLSKVIANPSPEIIDRAVELIISVRTYDQANKTVDDVIKIAALMNDSQLQKVLQAAKDGKADLQGAYGFDKLLNALANHGSIDKDRIRDLLNDFEILEPNWDEPIDD